MKTKNWTLRRAVEGDAEALAECIEAAYAQYATEITDLPPVSSNCAEEIAEHQVWVAEQEAEIVGGLVLVAQPDFLQLANVVVRPEQRGTGLGRTLIALAEAQAEGQGFREMRLNTHARMQDNVRLYTHLGWQTGPASGNKVSMRKTIRSG